MQNLKSHKINTRRYSWSFSFSIIHPSSRLHRERTSKKTRCLSHYIKFNYNLHNITIHWVSSRLTQENFYQMSSLYQGKNMKETRTNMEITTQRDDQIEHAFPPGCTIGPTMNQYRGKVDFLNRISQSPYLHLALSGLKLQELPFFHKALSRLYPQGFFSFFSTFKNSQ